MARLFVAVWPPPNVLDALEALPRPALPGVRWTTRSQWHATLRFLGEFDVDDAVAAFESVRGDVTVATLGPVTERLGDGVVMAPVAGLADLALAVDTAFGTDRADDRPFVGHLTLARGRDGIPEGVTGTPIGGSFAVGELALVASELHPEGSRYRDVARRSLAGA